MVTLSKLSKSFPGFPNPIEVLSNINFTIQKGEFVAIMGSSGSGKSTLLNMISSFDEPTSGHIEIGGKTLAYVSDKELAALRQTQIGFVFQDYNLIGHLSLWENVLIAGLQKRSAKKKVMAYANTLFKQFDLDHAKNRLPNQVSGGEQQRAAIIRALINNPILLLADEPTGNLNSAASREILNYLQNLNQTGQTIIMVTHDRESAICASRIIFLKDGCIKDELSFDNIDLSKREVILQNWLTQKSW